MTRRAFRFRRDQPGLVESTGPLSLLGGGAGEHLCAVHSRWLRFLLGWAGGGGRPGSSGSCCPCWALPGAALWGAPGMSGVPWENLGAGRGRGCGCTCWGDLGRHRTFSVGAIRPGRGAAGDSGLGVLLPLRPLPVPTWPCARGRPGASAAPATGEAGAGLPASSPLVRLECGAGIRAPCLSPPRGVTRLPGSRGLGTPLSGGVPLGRHRAHPLGFAERE